METLKTSQTKLGQFIADAEFNRFGVISAVLTVVGILGGVVTGLGAVENTVALSLVLIPTMVTLSCILAVQPMKYVMAAGIVSASIDVLMMAYYLFV
jgi:hypothetical protein